jgi:hypothetical protein
MGHPSTLTMHANPGAIVPTLHETTDGPLSMSSCNMFGQRPKHRTLPQFPRDSSGQQQACIIPNLSKTSRVRVSDSFGTLKTWFCIEAHDLTNPSGSPDFVNIFYINVDYR